MNHIEKCICVSTLVVWEKVSFAEIYHSHGEWSACIWWFHNSLVENAAILPLIVMMHLLVIYARWINGLLRTYKEIDQDLISLILLVNWHVQFTILFWAITLVADYLPLDVTGQKSHHVTTMLATSKNVLFPDHNHYANHRYRWPITLIITFAGARP